MSPGRRAIVLSIEGVVIFITALLLLGALTGQPVGLAYVETDSMQPTLEPGDGFIALPAPLAGTVDRGDVITYRAEYIQGGGLTTHRVIEVTDRGMITSGDANPFSDQQVGERPVRREEIVAVALQVSGHTVAIPHLGDLRNVLRDGIRGLQRGAAVLFGSRAFLGARGVALLLFVASVGAYIFDLVATDSRPRSRTRTRRRKTGIPVVLLIGLVAAAAILAATAAMTIPAGPQAIPFDAVDDSTREGGIAPGETASVDITIRNDGFVPVTTILGSGGQYVSTEDPAVVVPARGSASATVSVDAPPESGRYRGYVIQHRYLGILPTSLIVNLYRVHPWLPILVVDAFIGLSIGAIGRLVLGRGRIRFRSMRRRTRGTTGGWF